MAQPQVKTAVDAQTCCKQRWIPARRVIPDPAGMLRLTLGDEGSQVADLIHPQYLPCIIDRGRTYATLVAGEDDKHVSSLPQPPMMFGSQ